MKRIFITLSIIAIIMLSGCSSGQQTAPSQQTIKIGMVGPLSGDTAFLGEGMRNAMSLAIKDLGETTYNYELIFEDDQLNAKQTATAMQKLANVDNVDAALSISSGTGNVAAKQAQDYQIIHFGIASDANIAKGEYNFIHWTPPSEEAKVFVDELQKRKINDIALVSMNHAGVQAIVDEMKAELSSTPIDIVADELFNPGDRDFKTILMKTQKKNPKIYVLMAFTPELEILKKQMDELGIKSPVTGIESFELTEQFDLFEGQWYVNAADPSGKFVDEYRSAYDSRPKSGSANAYDIVNMLVYAYEKAGTDPSVKPDDADVIRELTEIKDFIGVLGPLTVDNRGIVSSPAVVRIIKDGEPVTLS